MTCELCNDTGYYGDNGPGKKGNTEWQPCECKEQSIGETLHDIGLAGKLEGDLVIVTRECFKNMGKEYEIALNAESLQALLRLLNSKA